MQNLKDRVKKCGLKINEQKTMLIANYDAFVADYLYDDNIEIARYIFVQATCEDFEIKMHEDSSFVKDAVETIFYSLRSDLRWNLYLVCVMEEHDFNILSNYEKIKFQNNKDFTRNIVTSLDKLEKEIPAGKHVFCRAKSTEINVENPLSIWSNILGEELQFSLNGYRTDMIMSYMNGDLTSSSSNAKQTPTSSSAPPVSRINSLKLTDYFRPHCFGASHELPFSKINIMAGANGSGKTSIFQAIELVMTGEVRTNEIKPSAEEKGSQVSLMHSEKKEMNIPSNTKEQKKRQSDWYNDRSGTATAQKLNNSFHRFNMFTPEDVFRASFSKDKENYIDIFTKMLFGEETETAQKSWQGYKKEFEKTYQSKREELEGLKQQLKLLAFPNEIKKEGIVKNMHIIGFQINPEAPMKELREIVIEVKTLCLAANSHTEIKTLAQVDSQLSQKRKKIKAQALEIQAKETETTKANLAVKDAKVKQADLATALNRINQEREVLINTLSWQEGFRFIADNYDGLKNLDRKKEERLNIREEAIKTKKFIQEYGFIMDFPGVYADYKLSQYKRKKASAKLEKLRKEEINLYKEQSELEISKTAIDHAIGNIKAYGRIYIEAIQDFKECPLCGNNVITIDGFKAHLEAEANETYGELSQITEKLSHLKKDIKQLDEELIQLDKKITQGNQIDVSYNEVPPKHSSKEKVGVDKLEVVQDYIRFCIENVTYFDELDSEVSMTETQYINDAPSKVKSMLVGNENYSYYIRMVEENLGIPPLNDISIPQRVSKLFTTVQSRQKELDYQQFAAVQSQSEILAEIKILEQVEKQLKEEIEPHKEAYKVMLKEADELKKLGVFFNKIHEYMNSSEIDRTALVSQCAALEKTIDDHLIQQKSLLERESIESEIHSLEPILARLKIANGTFSKLILQL